MGEGKGLFTAIRKMISKEDDKIISLYLPEVPKHRWEKHLKEKKEEFEKLLLPVSTLLSCHKLKVEAIGSKDMAALLNIFMHPGKAHQLLKHELIKLYVSLCSDPRNITVFRTLDPSLGQAWEKIMNTVSISQKALEECIRRPIISFRSRTWPYREYLEPFFSLLSIDRNQDFFGISRSRFNCTFYLSQERRIGLLEMFQGEDYLTPKVYTELPDEGLYVKENFESEIFVDINNIVGMMMTGGLITPSGKISSAKVKVLKKKSIIKDFTNGKEEIPLNRVDLLVIAVHTYLETLNPSKKRDSLKHKELAKFFLEKLPKYIVSTNLAWFIPTFKGFTKLWAAEAATVKITDIIRNLIAPSAEGWLSLENLSERFLCTPTLDEKSIEPYNRLFESYQRERNVLVRISDRNLPIHYGSNQIKWFEEIEFPFVVNWIKFLCSLGFLELAILKERDDESEWESALGGMRYVKMTEFGKYVFGISDNYDFVQNNTANNIDIDSRNAILTLSSNDNPYELFISEISDRISPSRFHISCRSIMKDCRKKEDVEDRLRNLEAIIGQQGAVALEEVLEEVRRRLDCTEKVKVCYQIVKIRKEHRDLMEFLLSNKDIRANVILAEQSVVLVDKTFYDRFLSICRSAGYYL